MVENGVYHYYNNCVSWPKEEVEALVGMVDNSIDITRRTFMAHVNPEGLKRLAKHLGFESHPSRGLTMSADYAVSYHRSKYKGERVYFLTDSAIEYVFMKQEN